MGQYHYLVNLCKRQVVHPHQIGNGLKLREQIERRCSTATALVMLLASSSKDGGRGGGDFRAKHPLVGSWAGDRIAFIGDYAEAGDLPGCDAALVYAQCHAACNPEAHVPRPDGWRDWTNVSAQVREMMTAEFGVRYTGEGWLHVVDDPHTSTPPQLCPDLVLARAATANPCLN